MKNRRVVDHAGFFCPFAPKGARMSLLEDLYEAAVLFHDMVLHIRIAIEAAVSFHADHRRCAEVHAHEQDADVGRRAVTLVFEEHRIDVATEGLTVQARDSLDA